MKYSNKILKKVSESKNCSYRVFKVNGVRSKWKEKSVLTKSFKQNSK